MSHPLYKAPLPLLFLYHREGVMGDHPGYWTGIFDGYWYAREPFEEEEGRFQGRDVISCDEDGWQVGAAFDLIAAAAGAEDQGAQILWVM